MEFINNYWREGHIMARDKKLFEYEYVVDDNVNFVLAIDKVKGTIEGIFGFLNCSKTNDSSIKDIWGSMWKVVESHDNMPFLGIELAKRVFKLTGCRTHIGNGANPNTTVPLRRLFFGDKVARMNHYYLLNTSVEEYKIALINNKVNADINNGINYNLIKFNSIDEIIDNFRIENVNSIPYKDSWYINKRYFCHPYYKYNVFGIQNEEGKVGALIMMRVVEANNSKVLRIVDYIGDQMLFAGLGNTLKSMLHENCYEYVDFYTLGFVEEYILKSGFVLRTNDDTNIIPNYFGPFTRENIDIWAHYKYDGTLFFKADGDQDRPN